MNEIGITAVLFTGLGLVCGIAMAFVARYFGVQEDVKMAAVERALPGANCGGCGYAGCSAYAKAVVEEGAPINRCGPGGVAAVESIGAIMGLTVEAPEPVMAFIKCGGDRMAAKRRSQYNGIADCAVASLVAGGWKECLHGCLGFGSCARACSYGAITIRAGLAIVNPEVCVGCGQCVAKCPRSLIAMVPVAHRVHVRCMSPEKGAAVRKICSTGCIGCGVCVKLEGGVSLAMEGALARVDYTRPPVTNEGVVAKCPAKCIVKFS